MTNGIADTMQALYRRFGEIPGVQIELHKSLLAVRVDNAAATATVFLQGAQISHYQRRNEQPVLWCSPLCDYSEHQPLRGGIPICWPWFGRFDSNPEPVRQQITAATDNSHGLVAQLPWKLVDIQVPDGEHTELIFSLRLYNGQEPAWPWATELTLTVVVGNTLSVRLGVDNQSNDSLAFTAALHSYLAISHIANVMVDGLEDLSFIDCTDNWQERRQRSAVVIDGEVDRIYRGGDRTITLVDNGWRRALTLDSIGSNSTVIWNPGIEKSRRLSHFDDGAYTDMLCIETANAGDDYIVLEPSQRHELGVTIASHPLN